MAMRQHRFTALGLALALVLGACGPDEQDFSAPDPDETPVAEQVPMDAPDNGEDEIPEAEPFESPLVEEDVTTAAPSGLISSTNPQERSRQVQRNLDAARDDNGDPFGILPVEVSRSQRQAEAVTQQVTGEPAPGAPATPGAPGAPGAPATDNGEMVTDGITAGPPLPPLTSQTVAPLPDLNPGDFILPPLTRPGTVDADDIEDMEPDEPSVADSSPAEEAPAAPAPPPPPSTDLARGTEVTGVMQVGGDIQIILQTPGSAFSRYVRLGDTIANGEVRVVRVESLSGNPVVILEQNGVEVARGVGEPGVTPEEQNMTNWVGRR